MPVTLTLMDTSAIVRSQQYKKNVYAFNGRNLLRACDGIGFRLAGIAKYPFTPVVAAGAAGLLTGAFIYVIQPVNSKQFNIWGTPVCGLPSSQSATIALNAQQCSISGIPATHPDSQVDYWYIYRTMAGASNQTTDDTAQNYHYVDKVAIGTTTYTDNVPDNIIKVNETARFNQQTPPTFKYGALYGERLFGTGFDTLSTGLATLATKTITFKWMTANVVTITTSTVHGYNVGDWVTINTGSKDIIFDGAVQIVSVPTTTTFTYNKNNKGVDVGSSGAPVAETGTTEQITFTGVALPDGITGCWFKASGDSRLYRIYGRNSATNIALVGVATIGYSGALSGAAFTIFRYPWEIYFSEEGDCEAWGVDGFDFINKKEIPGRDPCTAIFPYHGRLWVTSFDNWYAITGKGPELTDIQITPEPVFTNLGVVGGGAIDAIEDQIFYFSPRGPAMLALGAEPILIGGYLTDNYISKRTTPLTNVDLAKTVVFCKGRFVYFNLVANSGDSENSICYRFDRELRVWQQESGMYALFGFHDNGDGGLYGRTYYVQGASIFEPDVGTVDAVSTVITGAITGFTTTSITDTGANFPTAAGGLLEATVEIFDNTSPTPVSLGTRRINSQTGTTGFGWSLSAVGGGALANLAIGYTYKIGAIHWKWQTRTVQSPGDSQKASNGTLFFDHIDASAKVIVTMVYDNPAVTSGESTTKGVPTTHTANELDKKFPFRAGNFNISMILESHTNARVRQVQLDMSVGSGRKPS